MGLAPVSGMPGDVAPSRLMTVSFTSGTTAAPKAVAHRREGMIENAEAFRDLCGLGPEHRFLNVLPMTYMAGFYNLLLLPWLCGASSVIAPAFGPREALGFWSLAKARKVNVLWLAPAMLSILLKLARGEDAADWARDNVTACFVGTAPLSVRLRREFEARFHLAVLDNYGLSETLFLAANVPGGAREAGGPSGPGSVGLALPGVRLFTADASGAPLPPGAEGEIMADSGGVMAGYLEDGEPRPPARPFPTGDLGRIGPDGHVRVTGRKKDVIIRGGENVSPARVEEVLLSCPGVSDCAVTGVPHPDYGEQIAAALVVEGDFHEVEARARALCAGRLGRERPDRYFEIDALPRTANGKVNKIALRVLVASRLGTPGPPDPSGLPRLPGLPGRSGLEETPQASGTRRRIVDLTFALAPGMPRYPSPNHPEVAFTRTAERAEKGRQVTKLVLGTHSGTHVDAPGHFIEGGADVASLPLDVFVGPAGLADLSDLPPGREISLDALRSRAGEAPPERLVLRFGWSDRYGAPEYFTGHAWLSTAAAQWLADAGVRLLGMDVPQPDDPNSVKKGGPDSPVHKILLSQGVILLEYLCNLESLGPRFELVALPLKLSGADGSPVRCVAVETLP